VRASDSLSIFVVLQRIEYREIWTVVVPVVVVQGRCPPSCLQTETVQSDTGTIRGMYRKGRSELERMTLTQRIHIIFIVHSVSRFLTS
jgi:hypothetical protein